MSLSLFMTTTTSVFVSQHCSWRSSMSYNRHILPWADAVIIRPCCFNVGLLLILFYSIFFTFLFFLLFFFVFKVYVFLMIIIVIVVVVNGTWFHTLSSWS